MWRIMWHWRFNIRRPCVCLLPWVNTYVYYTYLCVSMAFDFPSMLRVILLFNVFFSPLLNFTGLPTPISSQSGARGFLQKPNTCCLFGLHNSMRRHRQTCGTSNLSPSHPDLFPPSSLFNLCLLFHMIHLWDASFFSLSFLKC